METLNAQQAAALLLCSEEKIEELARNGKIPAFKVGRSWIFPVSVLAEWMEIQARQNLSTAPKSVDNMPKYPAL